MIFKMISGATPLRVWLTKQSISYFDQNHVTDLFETCIFGVHTRHVLGHFATRTLTRKTSTGVGRSSSSCGISPQSPRESLLSASSPPSIPRGSLPFARPTGLWWPAGWWLRGLRHAATAVRRFSFQLSWGPSTFLASSMPKTREPGTVENNKG